MKNNEISNGIVLSTILMMMVFALVMFGILICIDALAPSSVVTADDETVRTILLSNVRPEPLERRMYALVCVLLPPFSLAVLWVNLRQSTRLALTCGMKHRFNKVLLASAILALFFLSDRPYIKALLGRYPIAVEQDRSFQMGGVLLASACLLILFFLRNAWAVISAKRLQITFFLSLVSVFPWRYFTEATVIRSGPWWGHADPIFYVLAQAIHGKSVLVDVVSQYGLYPEFFFIISKLFNPSIEAISVVFIAMQAVGLFCLMAITHKLIRSNALFFIISFAVLATSGNMPIYFAGGSDIYLQYWPIRFFFPAISIYFVLKYIETKKPVWMVFISVIASLAPFWNLDTGIVVLGAWIFYNLNMIFARPYRSPLVRQNLLNLATLGSLFLIFVFFNFAYVVWKSGGSFPNYQLLTYYQNIFWRDGFFMLPMPLRPSFWMYILLTYFVTICITQYFVLFKSEDVLLLQKSEFLLYLTAIGLGLFTYYQGRSHELNLLVVSYPFFIIIGALVDLLIASRAPLPRYLLCAVAFPGLVMMGLANASFLLRADRIYEGASEWRKVDLTLPPESGSHNEMHNLVHGRCYGKDKPGAVHAGIQA